LPAAAIARNIEKLNPINQPWQIFLSQFSFFLIKQKHFLSVIAAAAAASDYIFGARK
jgi:hypothetical protein